MQGYKSFNSRISWYLKYNIAIIALSTLQLALMIWVMASRLTCHQALPIAIYNVIASIVTVAMPIVCIYAAYQRKHFNTVLTYCLITIIAKVVQIFVLILFNHSGTCILPVTARLPIALYCGLELVCLGISSWILKRIKRVDRDSKAVIIQKKKPFLAD